MELKEALVAFGQLEARRRSWQDVDQEALSPIYNVRLDAMTTRREMERGFRLFVRIDDDVAPSMHAEAIGFVLEVASELKLAPSMENGGIELT